MSNFSRLLLNLLFANNLKIQSAIQKKKLSWLCTHADNPRLRTRRKNQFRKVSKIMAGTLNLVTEKKVGMALQWQGVARKRKCRHDKPLIFKLITL